MDRDAVCGRTRLELVGHRQRDAVLLPGLRVVLRADRVRVVLDQELLGQGEQIRLSLAHLLPPGVEVLRRDDLGREQCVVEVDQRLVVDHDVPPPGPGLELGQALEQSPVVVKEAVMRLPVALDQSVANKQVSRLLWVDARIAHLASGNQGHAIQGDLLQRHGAAALLLPMRLAVAALDQMAGEALDRRGVGACVEARPEPGGLDQFGRHNPRRLLLEERRTRRDAEARTPSADVLALLDISQTDVGKESRQQRPVDCVVVGFG